MEFNCSLSMMLFLPSSYISLTISIMMNKSCFMSSSKNLVKKGDFEDSLVEVVIMPMNKITSNKINKEPIQQPFATNLLCSKDCFEVLWDKRMPSALLLSCPLLDLAINSFPFTYTNSNNSQFTTIKQSTSDYLNTFQVNQAYRFLCQSSILI